MRKIIPLIVLILLSALFTNAQNLNQTENKMAKQLVSDHKASIGLSDADVSNLMVSSTFEDNVTGVRYVYLQQTYKSIPVFNQMLILSFRNGKLLSSAGLFDQSIEKSVTVSSGTPAVSAESAVQSALSDKGLRTSQMAIALNRKDMGRFVEFSNMGVSQENITAQLMWSPNEKTKTYELAWQIYIISKTTPDYWLVRVNALDNRIIAVDNLTVYDNWGTPETNSSIKYPSFLYNTLPPGFEKNDFFDFKPAPIKAESGTTGPTLADNANYRVIPIPFEAPSFMPGASTTWHAVRSNPWTNAGVVANAVTLKWHTGLTATDYNYTRGNNVWAYHDRTNANTGDPARSATSTTALPNLTFDFTPDYTLEPTVTSPPNQQFNITNLFYWNNLIHDIFYAYGFTEAGGNFQDDNLGRGGVGNDHVNAEAQDGSGSNNANFSTPADGGSGRMQMYLWTAPTPDRDGDVDNGIIIHEFGHGIAKRITGGPANVGCLTSSEQGGEGISDYFGLMLTQDWSTATLNTGFNSPRGIGTYALNQPPTGAGIRPTRYCTDLAINPTTYTNLPGQAIPHGVGYVWCTMLWEMTWELINEIGVISPNIYDWNGTGGNVRALRMVMEGLRTQPCQPGFVEARDHILKADTTLYGGIYYCAIMRAFAKRGVGIGALQGSSASITDQTPSFVGGGPSMSFTQNGAAGIPELQNIVYNHTVTAACNALTNFTLRDTLPANVNFVSATNGGVWTPATRVVAWPVNLAVGVTGSYGLTVQIAAGAYFPPVTLINETVTSTTIPAFWTTASTTANVWIAHNTRSNSAPNSFFTPNATVTSDQTIATTNSFAIGATAPTLSFWHWYNTEPGWDGAVLEISLNGGTTWVDIGAGNFTQNGYSATINTSANPLSGRAGWTGNSNAFIQSKVNMQPYANQANVRLRWRFGSDASVGGTGWNLDDIVMETRAVVNLRSNLFNAGNVRVDLKDTVTVILPPNAVPPTVTINQAAAQPDPTSVSPIDFTVVFDQPVIGFATGDVTLSGTAGATTAIVSGSGANYSVSVSGMTGSGTVIASIAAGVCTNTSLDPNVASTSTDNTVTYNAPPPPPGCILTFAYTGPPVAIPDNTPAGVNIPITVSGVGTVADLNFMLIPGAGACDATAGNVNASIDHTFNADLIIRLTSPSATTVTLVNRRGGGGNNFCAVTLDDDGSFPATSTMPTTGAIAGNYAPENPLSAFDGQAADGVWTLNVSDNAGIDVGSVRGFSLVLTGVSPTMNPVANDTICNGGAAGPYNFTSATPGVTYTWTNNNTAIGLAGSGSGNIPVFTATNTTTIPISGTITVTPAVGACFGTARTFSIRVLPTGNVNAVPNQTVCKGQPTAPVTFTGTVPGTNFLWTNSNTLIGLAASGNGNIASFVAQNPTSVQQVATITVTPSYGAGGLACMGTQRTFTITVNPNASLLIVADPGTVLCEGDPTLLTVIDAAGITPPGTLYTQGAGAPANGVPSQVFEPANTAFTSQGADDFTVPAGAQWTLSRVTASGIGAGAPTSVNIFFYNNSGANLPGSVVASHTNLTTFTRTGGNYSINIPSTVLNPGTYWVSIQVNMSFAAGGQWFWGNYGTTNVGNQAAWQNPGGGFATPCNSWGYAATGCGVGGGANRNLYFSVYGTSVLPGPQSTGTFLWSPAAGLSSTTSNPVAASPMNTTTYTVRRTTVPSGCIDSANITITVNRRPVVTTQPTSRTNCVGNIATFTVAGTGTALTYQWQERQTPAGAWVNLANGAPYAGVTTATLTINPVTQLMNGYAYRCVLGGTCAPGSPALNVSNAAILTVNPNPNVSITPPVSCGGVAGISGTLLSVGSAPPPIPGSVTVNSGTISVPIPDNTQTGVTTNLVVAGIPGTATITGMRVNFSMSHTWAGDVVMALRAPNNNVLNLNNQLSGTGGAGATTSMTNTTISSAGTAALSTGTGTYTGIFRADAFAGAAGGPTGMAPTGTTWTQLFGTPNGTYTIGLYDNFVADIGTLTNWSITIDYTTPGGGGGPVLSYVWSPLAGLYNNATATNPYLGTNTPTVYAAPTALTVYTVRATDVATGCFTDATAIVNYTPPAPTVTPASVTMCLGDPAVKLTSSSSSTSTATFTSGTVSVPIPEGTFPTGPYNAGVSTIPVSGIPAGATISRVNVRMNITHPYVGDVVAVLRAPNGQIINLDALLNLTNNAGANFVNTVISSAGTTALSAGTAPWTNTYRADLAGATFTVFGFTLPGGPIGYIPTSQAWSSLYSVPNGNWTLAMYDAGAPDLGTLTNWSMDITYVVGVPATPAVWTPATGLFSNAAATTPYVAGTAVDSVWTRPTPAGVYPYQATVQNLITTTSNPASPTAGGNGQALVTFNITNNNTIPVTFSRVSSRVLNSGANNATIFYKTSPIAGPPGAISAANGWIQFGTGPSVGVAGATHEVLSGLTLNIPAGATYGIALQNLTAANAANTAYTNGGGIVTYTDGGCTITTGGNVGYGGVAAPGSPTFNPRNFNGSVVLLGSGPGTCTSPGRTVVVTVNAPTTLNATLPVNQTVCTDKVATFSAAVATGSGPHSYQWQVSTNNGNPPWNNIANGGVYSGATSATLTITAPPVSMNQYQYRCVVTGAAPCAAVTSRQAELLVNPLPTVVISANPYTSLFPGLRSTLSSTVTPNAAATYTWTRNGTTVAGANTGTLVVDVDGLGDYRLRVTDVNGCTNSSNIVTIKDSASGKCFLYPNPNSGKFQVRYYSVANNILPRSLTIFDAKGDRVLTQMYTIGRPYDRMDVDMRAFGKGLYWVEIGDHNGSRLAMCRVAIQ